MKKILLLLLLTLTGCASFQVSTLNHDSVRVVNNEFELQRLLRTDFNFRFDYAQYALRQPRSFDWNNRILGNRYNRYNPYYGYSSYWNRDQMWNDWVWGITPHRWSPFGYDRWGYNWYSPYQWSPFGNNWGSYQYYGWNNGFYNRYRGTNTAYHTGRRGTTTTRNGRAHAAMIESSKRRVVNNNRVVTTPRTRTVIKNKPRVINNKPRINRRPPVNNIRPSVNVPRPSTTSRPLVRSTSTSTNPRRKN